VGFGDDDDHGVGFDDDDDDGVGFDVDDNVVVTSLYDDFDPSIGKLVLPESTLMYIKQNKEKDMQLKKGGH
jgi:hypothetical protein